MPKSVTSRWGRPYWYHSVEKRSVWEKPVELKTERERRIDATPWREYKSGDRSYYVNRETKKSTWKIPEEIQQILDTVPDEPPEAVPMNVPASPHAVAPNGSPNSPAIAGNLTPFAGTPETGNASPMLGMRASSRPVHPAPAASTSSTVPMFTNTNDAELAFMKLLQEKGIDEHSTWEQAIREIVMDPMYKAFKTLAERKAAFTKYQDRLRSIAAEERAEKEARIRPAMVKALAGEKGGLKWYASFATFRKKLSAYSFWNEVEGDEELAMKLYESIRKDARDKHDAAEKALEKHNENALNALLKTMEIDVHTRWRDVHRTIMESDEYREDKKLHSMPLARILALFEKHIDQIEAQEKLVLESKQKQRARTARKAREEYRALLQEQVAQGVMTARSTWAAVAPQIQNDPRLQALAKVPGSTPQQLFYDMLDELERGFAAHTKAVQAHLQTHPMPIDDTHWPSFLTLFRSDDAPAEIRDLAEHELHEIYDELLYQAQREVRGQKRRAERRLRHHVDDLRYAMKKASPPLDIAASFDDVQPQLQAMPEFQELERLEGGIDAARIAWDRFVKRECEKRQEKSYLDLDETSDERKRKESAPDPALDPRAVRRRVQYDTADSV
ncbi:U1 snRNP protein [Malassezia yamatoensis]|uniref:U1 snRNP protein n=1 Tax=Malassezia yamatoensis TaxID=253288 RepID=A0AAJ6CJ59_9BASI|nr:U1 snRNP protein [Malassezia yamatoensis]